MSTLADAAAGQLGSWGSPGCGCAWPMCARSRGPPLSWERPSTPPAAVVSQAGQAPAPWGAGTFAGVGPSLLDAGPRSPPRWSQAASGLWPLCLAPASVCMAPHLVTCSDRPSQGASPCPLLLAALELRCAVCSGKTHRGETEGRKAGDAPAPQLQPHSTWANAESEALTFAKLWVRTLGTAQNSQGKEGALGGAAMRLGVGSALEVWFWGQP